MTTSQLSRAKRPFGVRDQIGYAFADAGGTLYNFMAGFVMVFCTYVLGISPIFMGTMFLVTKIWDAFNDPLLGQLPDRFRLGRSGERFKPWIRAFMVPLAIATALMFVDISSWEMMWKYIWVTATFVIAEMLYTLTSVPYGALSSIMSDEPADKAKLSTARALGAQIGGALLSTIAPLVLFNQAKEYIPERFLQLAIVVGVLIVVFYVILLKNAEERVETYAPAQQKFNYLEVLGQVVRNLPLLGTMVASIGNLFVNVTFGALTAYVFKEYYRQPEAAAFLGFATLLLVLGAYPFVPRLVARFGKRRLLLTVLSLSTAVYVTMLVVKPASVWVFLALYYVSALGQVVFFMLIWAMVNDTIDYHEYRFTNRNDGTLFSLYAFSRKVGPAIAQSIASFALVWAGYNETLATQSDAFGASIFNYMMVLVLVGAAFQILALVFMYRLDEGQIADIAAVLQQRREQRRLQAEAAPTDPDAPAGIGSHA